MAVNTPTQEPDYDQILRDLYAPVRARLEASPAAAFAFSHPGPVRIQMHTHEYTEVTLVAGGGGHLRAGEHLFDIAQGDVFVVPPGMSHGYSLSGDDGRICHLVLPPIFLQRHGPALRLVTGFPVFFTLEPYFRRETGFRYRLRLDQDALPWVAHLFDRLEHESASETTAGPLALDALALYTLAHLCKLYSSQQPQPGEPSAAHALTQALEAVFELVAARYQDKLTLSDLARAARLQPNYFCRTFRRVMGTTPVEYLHQYRVQVARRLLRESGLSVTEIAHATGFYDASHFSRVFSRITGLTPMRYRKSTTTPQALVSAWGSVYTRDDSTEPYNLV